MVPFREEDEGLSIQSRSIDLRPTPLLGSNCLSIEHEEASLAYCICSLAKYLARQGGLTSSRLELSQLYGSEVPIQLNSPGVNLPNSIIKKRAADGRCRSISRYPRRKSAHEDTGRKRARVPADGRAKLAGSTSE